MTSMRQSGYGYITPAPAKVEAMQCQVCGETLDVRRNVNGPTAWAESMAGGKHLHDVFSCPNSGRDWHDQAIELMKAIRDTPSKALSNLIEAELQQVLRDKKATK